MEKKVCTKCKEEKDVTEFHTHRKKCKECISEYKKKYYIINKDKIIKHRNINKEKIKVSQKEYYIKNKEKLNEYGVEYRKNNREKRIEINREYRKNNKEKIKEIDKEYRKNNKEKINKRRNIRLKNDPIYKLRCNICSLIHKNFTTKGYTKNSRTHKILGCTYEEFKTHIESQFKEWMDWGNYGKYNGEERYGWDLDHIIPVSSGKCVEDIIRLNHHSNLQPLCSYVNRYVKRDKIVKPS